MRMVRSKVAGVSHANLDGSSRQRIIRKYCRAGRSLDVRLEPDNRYSEDAMGLWVRGRCLLIIPAWYQVGYIKNELASQIREDVVRGCPISVRILEVTGGVSEKTLGSIFVLRAIGVVAVIVGSGVSCLGIVYFLTDSRNERS
jgi:hypothetical protein